MKIKITKEKLKTFLTYESVKIIAVCLVVCFALYIVFNALSTKPSYGQEIYVLYEDGIGEGQDLENVIVSLMTKPKEGEKKANFSYEVLKVNKTGMDPSGYTTEYILTKVHAAMFEDDVVVATKNLYESYVYGNFAVDIPTYLSGAIAFCVDNGLCNQNGEFSRQAVEDYFYRTREKDKRFKTSEQLASGVDYEYQRVTALYAYATELIEVFNAHPELLDEKSFDFYGTQKTGKYGLIMGALSPDAKSLFYHVDADSDSPDYTANGIYIAFGDNADENGDLNYECIPLLYEIINRYTTYLN